MDSVGIGGGANVVSMALVVRAQSAVDQAGELCAQARGIRQARHKALVLRARSAVTRAGELCTEASTNRMAAEALINSLITAPLDVAPPARNRV